MTCAAELLGDLGDRHAPLRQELDLPLLRGGELRPPPAFASTGACRRKSCLDALLNQRPFKLRQGGKECLGAFRKK